MEYNPSRARQFLAVLHKNILLQTRSRRAFGLAGLPALLFQIALPACFFLLMIIPKHYIKPINWPQYLESQQYDIDVSFWAGASPYEGKATCMCSAVPAAAAAVGACRWRTCSSAQACPHAPPTLQQHPKLT